MKILIIRFDLTGVKIGHVQEIVAVSDAECCAFVKALLTPLFVPLSTAMIACVPSSVGFHPEIEPSSLTKIKKAGAEFPFFVTWKNCVPLKTCPVGFPVPLFRAAVGIVTISETAVPS